jgi:hypothetical protein
MLDLYTMAGLILYTACTNNNQNVTAKALEVSKASAAHVDVKRLFERCKTGDRAAILEMIALMVPGLQAKVKA